MLLGEYDLKTKTWFLRVLTSQTFVFIQASPNLFRTLKAESVIYRTERPNKYLTKVSGLAILRQNFSQIGLFY